MNYYCAIPARASSEVERASCFGDSDLVGAITKAEDGRDITLGESDLSRPGFEDRFANGGSGGAVRITGRFDELNRC